MKRPVAHWLNSTWFWIELPENCCEPLKFIMKYISIQFCERPGHGRPFHALGCPNPESLVWFLCNCCSTTLVPSLKDQNCCSDTTGRAKEAGWRQNHCHSGSRIAMVAKQRHSGRYSDRSMDFLVGQRRHNGGTCTMEAEASLKLIHNDYSIYCWTVRILLCGDHWPTLVHPFCDHGFSCAFLLPPLNDLWAADLLGDLCATVLNMLKTSRWPWHPWQGLNVLCATLELPTKATFRLPMCLQRQPGQFCGCTREAQRSQPLCKGILNHWPWGDLNEISDK